MGYKLAHLPLLKLLLPLLAGILAFNAFPFSFLYILFTCILLLFLLIFSHLTVKNVWTKNINTAVACLFIFCVGGLIISQQKLSSQQQHFSNNAYTFARGTIVKPLEEKDKSYRTVVEISELIDSAHHSRQANGKLFVYLQKDIILSHLEIGDEILFTLNYKEVDGSKNPGQFDYKKYLSFKSIYHQQYLRAENLKLVKKHHSLFVKRISNRIGVYMQSILRKYIPGKENFSLADGILLGHRADIDVELYNAFAYTGILHILSVSGLHVGIIYGMLQFFLSFISDRNRSVRIGKFVFVFLFIWMFTLVTGFSAACVRAALLFSLLNYGKLSKENVNNLNLLCGAAVLQLLIDPNNIFDIGFQLSYLAMLGLFIFYKPIYALFYHPNKLIDWTWKLWSASIAAQVFTVPLSIYYFGNFPTYFLFANIFAIPLSTLILWLSISLLPLSFIPFLAHIIGVIDSCVIRIFIQFTWFFSNLPIGKLSNLYVSKAQMISMLIAAICLALFVIQKKTKFLFTCQVFLLISIANSYMYNIQQIKKDEIVLYSVPKSIAIGENICDQQNLYCDDSLSSKSFSFCIANSYRLMRIKNHHSYFLKDSLARKDFYADKNLLFTHGKSFYFLNRNNSRKKYGNALKIDHLVISGNCYLDVESLKTNFVCKKIFLSSDNDARHIRIYRKLLDEQKLSYIDLSERYYIIPL